VRQHMMDTGLSKAATDRGRLRCIREKQALREQRRLKCISETSPTSEPSTNSTCSSTDTQSDISDEHDTVSTSFEVHFIDAPPGLERTLRASAPEFVPHGSSDSKALSNDSVCSTVDTASDISEDPDTVSSSNEMVLRATATEFVPNVVQPSVAPPVFSTTPMPDVHAPVLSSTPFYGFQADAPSLGKAEFVCDGSFGGHAYMELTEDFRVDLLEEASQRYIQWRQYCGLPEELSDAPQGFSYCDAHSCSLAEVFAMSKPGELFL